MGGKRRGLSGRSRATSAWCQPKQPRLPQRNGEGCDVKSSGALGAVPPGANARPAIALSKARPESCRLLDVQGCDERSATLEEAIGDMVNSVQNAADALLRLRVLLEEIPSFQLNNADIDSCDAVVPSPELSCKELEDTFSFPMLEIGADGLVVQHEVFPVDLLCQSVAAPAIQLHKADDDFFDAGGPGAAGAVVFSSQLSCGELEGTVSLQMQAMGEHGQGAPENSGSGLCASGPVAKDTGGFIDPDGGGAAVPDAWREGVNQARLAGYTFGDQDVHDAMLDFCDLSLPELVEECALHDISAVGQKNDILFRLEAFYRAAFLEG